MEQASPELRKALIEAVKTQIKTNNPPEVKQTFERLLRDNISVEDAYVYLVQALIYEMFRMMKGRKEYSKENHVKLLNQLPNLD